MSAIGVPRASPRERGRSRRFQHPERLVAISFAVTILSGAGLLMLPWSTEAGDGGRFVDALFTSTSAVCVTGLTVVDTGSYWSEFGQFVIMLLIQVGGLGIMTLTALGLLVLGRSMGLRRRVLTQAGSAAPTMADARRLARAIGLFTLIFESTLTVVLGLRFWLSYDETFWVGMWNGLFHTISAFNNAGFGLQPTNIVPYAQDPIMSLGLCLLIVSGGLGFPVWLELRDQVRPAAARRRLSVHTKVMLVGTAALLVGGTLAVLIFEWSNPATLGQWNDEPMRKLMPAFFQGVTPRTAGFNTLDYSQMHEETWLTQMMLMFVGGGPASTAGGIKVTSFVVLLAFVWSQARGASDTNLFGRRMPTDLIRISFTIAFLAMNAVVIGCLVIMLDTDHPLSHVLFESISAFGTVGLSTGITFDLPDLSKYVLIALMFVGRTGPYTLALAFALRRIPVKHRYAEESPIVA